MGEFEMKSLKKIIAVALSLVCLASCSAGGENAQESETTAAVSAETETVYETVSETTTTEAAETAEETTAETEAAETSVETTAEPLSLAWEEKPIISSLPFTIDYIEPGEKECSEKSELVEKMLEQLGLWEPPQTEIIDGVS